MVLLPDTTSVVSAEDMSEAVTMVSMQDFESENLSNNQKSGNTRKQSSSVQLSSYNDESSSNTRPKKSSRVAPTMAYKTLALETMHGRQQQFEKTKPCKFHEMGVCAKMELCKFAHDDVEKRNLPDLGKTAMCPSVAKKTECTRNSCAYAHSKDELRATTAFAKTKMCKYYRRDGTLKGKRSCVLADNCRYAHSEVERCKHLEAAELAEAADRASEETVKVPERMKSGKTGQNPLTETLAPSVTSLFDAVKAGNAAGRVQYFTTYEEPDASINLVMAVPEVSSSRSSRKFNLNSVAQGRGSFFQPSRATLRSSDAGSESWYPKPAETYLNAVAESDHAWTERDQSVYVSPPPGLPGRKSEVAYTPEVASMLAMLDKIAMDDATRELAKKSVIEKNQPKKSVLEMDKKGRITVKKSFEIDIARRITTFSNTPADNRLEPAFITLDSELPGTCANLDAEMKLSKLERKSRVRTTVGASRSERSSAPSAVRFDDECDLLDAGCIGLGDDKVSFRDITDMSPVFAVGN